VVNLSIEEKEEIEKLLSVNISKLTETELKNYVETVCKYPRELRHRLELRKLMRTEMAIRNLSQRLEKIIEQKLKLLNITNINRTPLLRLRYAHSLAELHRLLAELRRTYIPRVAGMFSNIALSFVNRSVVRIANTDSKQALRIALVNIDRAIQALNTTLKGLELENASPRAIEAVKGAIVKLYTVKELLTYVESETENIENITIIQPRLRLRLRLRTALRICMGMMLEDVNISISTMIDKLEKLMEIAKKIGEEELVRELNTTLEELKQIQSILAKGANLSIEQKLALIIRAKALLYHAKMLLLRTSIQLGITKDLQTNVTSLVEEAKSLLDEVYQLKRVVIELQFKVIKMGYPHMIPLIRRLWIELTLAERLIKRVIIEAKKGNVVWAQLQLSTAKQLLSKVSKAVEKLLSILEEERPIVPTPPGPPSKPMPTTTPPATKGGPKGPRGRP